METKVGSARRNSPRSIISESVRLSSRRPNLYIAMTKLSFGLMGSSHKARFSTRSLILFKIELNVPLLTRSARLNLFFQNIL